MDLRHVARRKPAVSINERASLENSFFSLSQLLLLAHVPVISAGTKLDVVNCVTIKVSQFNLGCNESRKWFAWLWAFLAMIMMISKTGWWYVLWVMVCASSVFTAINCHIPAAVLFLFASAEHKAYIRFGIKVSPENVSFRIGTIQRPGKETPLSLTQILLQKRMCNKVWQQGWDRLCTVLFKVNHAFYTRFS